MTKNEIYLLEDYKAAKTELLSTINIQYTIISILATATAAAVVYLFKRDAVQVAIFAYIVIPAVYAFFGLLWLDQVYRQRRLAAHIFLIESEIKNSEQKTDFWEHFVQDKKKEMTETKINTPSRSYYFVCLGLFYGVPITEYLLALFYSKSGFVLCSSHKMFIPSCIGILIYIGFIIFSIKYIKVIRALVEDFQENGATETSGQ